MTVEVDGIASVGDVLAGKYRVEKILGVGGMGMVVAATHLELDQRVALKFMLPSSLEAPGTSARFLREARAAGRLNSDHVCRVIDVGRFDSGTPYIVMEYLQGENLGALLRRRGPLRVPDAVGYILQGIEGIAEAHANGIIHRDLKPDNLFLHKRNDGGTIVKVLDFGISKASASGISTGTGDVFGSPAYMAPEQMESSGRVDQRADVWSLGVVLYQLVAGRPPFQADSLPLLCLQVVNDEPRPMSEVRGDLPEGFEAVVMRCLRKDAVQRYADVGELALALAPFGPKNATTSASRIQIVLRRIRTDSASVISTEFSTVERDDPGAASRDAALPRDPAMSGETSAKHAATTLGATSGQSLASLRGERRSWGLPGALIGAIVVVVVAIVVVWRSDRVGDPASAAPRLKPTSATAPVAAPTPRPPPPIVEPIVEPVAEPVAEPIAEPGVPVAGEPGRAPVNAPAVPSLADRAADPVPAPAAVDRAPDPAPKADRKKRKTGTKAGSKAGTKPGTKAGTKAGTKPGSDAGSAVPDDDKWMHMTHDDKKP